MLNSYKFVPVFSKRYIENTAKMPRKSRQNKNNSEAITKNDEGSSQESESSGTELKRKWKEILPLSSSSSSVSKKSKKDDKELLNIVHTDVESIDLECTKKTTDGKDCNFKIVSWNVAGIRAWLKKEGMKYLKTEGANIVCVQEVKCSEKKMPREEVKLPGYQSYWANGVKEGYAGVGVYTKEKPINVQYGIGLSEFDSEGRVITAEFDKFYLVCVYVPNAGAGLKNLERRMKWDVEFRKYLKNLDAEKPVILAGDLNVAHEPIDLANPKTNTKSAGFTQEERDNFTELLNEGFVDTFRKLNPEKTGAYTYWTYLGNARSRNTGWRLDYFVVSERLMTNICDNVIRNQVYGSDHCPILLQMNI